MGGVADDGVGDVLEVAADLVPPTRLRLGFDQGDAGVRVAVHRDVELPGGQAPHMRERVLRRCLGRGVVRPQGVVHAERRTRPTAHHGQVAFVHLALRELLGHLPCRLRAQPHQQDAGRAFVQPVHREDMLTELVAQGLHDEAGFARVQPGAVDQPARRLVDGQPVALAPKHRQRRAVRPLRKLGHAAQPPLRNPRVSQCCSQAASSSQWAQTARQRGVVPAVPATPVAPVALLRRTRAGASSM